MKKNLRIVSAAAAALLAVAPVAATAVSSVSAASIVNPVNGETTNVSAGDLNVSLKAGEKATFDDAAKKQLTEEIAKSIKTDASQIELSNVQAGEIKNNKQTVTFQVRHNETLGTWANGHVTNAQGAVFNNLKWSNNNGHYVTLTNGTAPVTFSVTVNYTAATPAKDTASDKINAGSSSIFDADANTAVNVSAVAKDGAIPSAINGNIVYTDAQGAQHTALLHGNQNTTVYEVVKDVVKPVSASELKSNKLYYAHFNHVTMSLGNDYSGKTVTFTLTNGSSFAGNVAGAKYSNYYKSVDGTNVPRTITVTADANGVADLGTVVSRFYAYDAKNLQEVHFYAQKTGNVVTSGSVDLHAVNGKLSVQSVFAAMSHEYVASQLVKGTHSTNKIDTLAPQNNLRDQLKKQNIDVDPNGYFTAPASFTLNMDAVSKINGAKATLPVTVNVDNVTPAASQETTKTVKIMHIATIYDKNGKATHEPALRAYNTVSVVSEPVSLKDEKGKDAGKFYKLAGKDQYIKVGNVDGTSRSLKHNSYVYKSTGKRRGKTVLKKGSSVTTYGKSFMIAGHQMYRIGENQYVKKANF